MKKVAVLLVAHGSKRDKSNEEFVKLSEKIRLENKNNFDMIEYSFLEFEEPTIEMAIKKMHDKNIEKIYVYPYFLNSGKHVSVDIPNIISKLQNSYENMEIELLSHFGISKSVVSIISADLKEIF